MQVHMALNRGKLQIYCFTNENPEAGYCRANQNSTGNYQRLPVGCCLNAPVEMTILLEHVIPHFQSFS
jgi:hypothetical protein